MGSQCKCIFVNSNTLANTIFTRFQPSIIKAFGYNTVQSQLLTVPTYVVAAICVVLSAYFSDKLQMRWPFLFACGISTIFGFILNVACTSIAPRYVGLFFVAAGAFSGGPSM